MDYQAKFGPYALVAGASTTVGEQFARQLAAKGMNVVLVARRLPLLEKIAGEIREAYGVDARPVAMDLTADDAVDQLAAAVADLEIGILVVNANIHKVGLFHSMDRATKVRMLRMNTELPMLLTDHFGGMMVERGRGAVIYVNVLNSLSPIDIDGIFQGTKAFLRVFAESLWLEYRRHGVQVSTVLVNGIEGSESYEKKLSPTSRVVAKVIGGSMKPERIVASALRQFEKGKWVCVPDYPIPVNQLAVWSLDSFRAIGGTSAAKVSSGIFGMLLDGDEVQATKK
ncbi:MAG: SDR family NAD(P)-dependent oxidoreductase [Myxococcales bacterium]|nr:SDR family NAD(P)-dependent oxidoreductase [Myxococcales bacterium]